MVLAAGKIVRLAAGKVVQTVRADQSWRTVSNACSFRHVVMCVRRVIVEMRRVHVERVACVVNAFWRLPAARCRRSALVITRLNCLLHLYGL